MAEKQVVRQDVVEITWDIDDKPMKDLLDMMKNFKKVGKDAQSGVGKGWNTVVSGANKVKSALTPLHDGLKKLGTTAIDAGKKIAKGIGTATQKAASVAKTAIKGLTAAFGAFTAVGTLAVKNYADYEQLVGGVETLFGAGGKTIQEYAKSVGKTVNQVGREYADLKNAEYTVLQNANKAYKSAGMSANAYMETVTSFSASLIQSVGGDTKKAARLADQAIIDMSDNANKMGTSMESIQNAYQGFAKQNFTMLDNLKLGYGGTQEEMKRLLKDAQKITGIKYNMSSFADITEAIHVIQNEMGITGTTAKEASSTIQGSISSMKAAWTNFLTGMADPKQDFDALVGNLVDSIVAVGKNLIPRIKILVPRLAAGLKELGAELAPYIPPMFKAAFAKISQLAPVVGQAVSKLILKAKEYLIANKDAIWSGFKDVMAQGINLIAQLFTGEGVDMESIKTKIQGIADKVMAFVGAIKENWPTIKGVITGVVIAIGLLEGAFLACNAIIGINNAIMTVKAAKDAFAATKASVLAAKQWLLNTSFYGCPVVWLIAAFVALIAIVILVVKHWDTIKAAVLRAWTGFQNFLDKLGPFGAEVKARISDTVEGIKQVWGGIKQIFKGIIDFVVGVFTGDWKRAWDGVIGIFGGIWESLKGLAKAPLNAVIRLVNAAIGGLNSISIDIPDWIPGMGGKKFGINLKKIPELEKGGVLRRGQVGLLEGNGAEAVVPLEKNTGWIKAVATAMSRNTASNANYPRNNYQPGTSGSKGKQSYSENNTYAPSFTLNYTGTTDRTAERIIKKWVSEALNDTFDSMGRTSPRLTEV